MATMLASRNSNLSTFNAININYSTLVGSSITTSTITNSTINATTITSRQVNCSTLAGSSIISNVVTGTITTSSIAAATDLIAQGIYLTPSPANSATILQYIQKVVNTIAPNGILPFGPIIQIIVRLQELLEEEPM
jgi:hypothetical protein